MPAAASAVGPRDAKGVLREARIDDIPAMHRVRLAVRENRLTSTAIREAHYVPEITVTGRGWVVTEDDVVVGFAVGNRDTRNIWALFVDPEREGKGYGRRLHDAMVAWLFEQGVPRLWLSTDPGTRAQRFYAAAGWRFCRVLPDGEHYHELPSPVKEPHTMLRATCHCGAVAVSLPRAPERVTNCNCSICRRYGTLWGYFPEAEVRIEAAPGALQEYFWGREALAFVRCATCGCITHWRPRKPGIASVGVNVRLFEPEILGPVRIRLLDGAVTEEYVGEYGPA